MMPASNASVGQSVGFPDTCLTPAAPSPVPVPYPNMGANAMSLGFVPTVLVNMMPVLNMMTKSTMTNGMEGGASHPLFKQMGGYTAGQPTILYNGAPAISLLSPTNGNMYNNPSGAKLVPDAVTTFLNSAADCCVDGVDHASRPGGEVREADVEAMLAVMGRQPDHSAGWSLDIRTMPGGGVRDAWVRHVRRHTPAWECGLQPGDRLVTVNGRPVRGMRVRQLAAWRLAIGDHLVVVVSRDGIDELLTVSAEKRHTEWPLVRGWIDDDGITGVIEITAFAPRVVQLVDREVSRLVRGGATSLMIDLCHNPGGDAGAALDLADRFVPRGTVLAYCVDADGARNEAVARDVSCCDLPLTLRVNAQTASAAELFAGALQAAGRARVVGTRTFGKGAAVMFLGRGTGDPTRDIVIEVARFELPGGRMIEGTGIAPDRSVPHEPRTNP